MSESKRVITPEAILSYPAVFEPRKFDPSNENEQPKFQATLVFTPEAQQTAEYKAMQRTVVEVAKEAFGDKAGEVLKGMSHPPFRKDGESKGYPEGSVYVHAKTTRRPGIVSLYKDPATGKARVITNPEEVYPGVIVRASLVPYAKRDLNKGVFWSLSNIQVLRDGERLDNRVAAEDEFEAQAPETDGDALANAPAAEDDLSDLLG